MPEVVTWAALGGAIVSVGGLIKFWMDRAKAEARADAAYAIATSALAKAEVVSSQLSEARIEMAEKYASHKDLAAAEVRLVGAVDGLKEEFRLFSQRLDRIIDNLSEHRPKMTR